MQSASRSFDSAWRVRQASLRMTIFTHPSEAWMGHPLSMTDYWGERLLEDGSEDADEGVGFGEEGIVAVVGGHLAVVTACTGGLDDGGK